MFSLINKDCAQDAHPVHSDISLYGLTSLDSTQYL